MPVSLCLRLGARPSGAILDRCILETGASGQGKNIRSKAKPFYEFVPDKPVTTIEAEQVIEVVLKNLKRFEGKSKTRTVTVHALGQLTSFIDTFRSRMAGFKQDLSGMEDVYRGLHGKANTKQGEVFAKAISEAWEGLRTRFNAAGGDIVERQDWGWSQSHDASLMKDAGKAKWVEDVFPLLDRSRMFDAAGNPLTTDKQVREVAGLVWEKATTNALDEEVGGGIAQRVGHRTLSFKSGDAFLSYHKKYGQGDLLNNIFSEFDRMSRDVALMEILGPYPTAAIRNMKDLVRSTEGESHIVNIQNLYDEIVGSRAAYADTNSAKLLAANRNLLTSARLGSSVIMAVLGDPIIANLTAKFNGMSSWKLMKGWQSSYLLLMENIEGLLLVWAMSQKPG